MNGNVALGTPGATAPARWPDGSVAVLGELLGLRRASGDDPVTHLALPRASDPKFYVPVAHRPAAATSCLAYNRLRPRPVAMRRTAVGWGLRFGIVQRLRGTPMTTGVPTGRFAASAGGSSTPLVEELARRLGRVELVAATSPRPVDPSWTPTLQLFDPDGTPVGYAKVGWTDLTRSQVDVEAGLLERIGCPGGSFASPAPIDFFTWGNSVVSVTAPMPAGVARVSEVDGPCPNALIEVAALDGPPTVAPFGSSGGASWADQLVADDAGGIPGWAGSLLANAWATARRRLGDRPVRLGRWHGDWVPWNIARSGSDLWVWDWEYSGAKRPVGLDAYHWHYQQARVVKGDGVVAALETARRLGSRHLDDLGVDGESEPVIAAAHVLELAVRTVNAARLGAPAAALALEDLPAMCAVLLARSERNDVLW